MPTDVEVTLPRLDYVMKLSQVPSASRGTALTKLLEASLARDGITGGTVTVDLTKSTVTLTCPAGLALSDFKKALEAWYTRRVSAMIPVYTEGKGEVLREAIKDARLPEGSTPPPLIFEWGGSFTSQSMLILRNPVTTAGADTGYDQFDSWTLRAWAVMVHHALILLVQCGAIVSVEQMATGLKFAYSFVDGIPVGDEGHKDGTNRQIFKEIEKNPARWVDPLFEPPDGWLSHWCARTSNRVIFVTKQDEPGNRHLRKVLLPIANATKHVVVKELPCHPSAFAHYKTNPQPGAETSTNDRTVVYAREYIEAIASGICFALGQDLQGFRHGSHLTTHCNAFIQEIGKIGNSTDYIKVLSGLLQIEEAAQLSRRLAQLSFSERAASAAPPGSSADAAADDDEDTDTDTDGA